MEGNQKRGVVDWLPLPAIAVATALALLLAGVSLWRASAQPPAGGGVGQVPPYTVGPGMMGPGMMGPGYGPGMMGPGYGDAHYAVGPWTAVVAEALGVTLDELREARQSGKSVEAIAAGRNVEFQTVVDAAMAPFRASVEAAVAAGRMSHERADALMAAGEARIRDQFQWPGNRMAPGYGTGPRYGMGPGTMWRGPDDREYRP